MPVIKSPFYPIKELLPNYIPIIPKPPIINGSTTTPLINPTVTKKKKS
jgi:hypothetical protein